MPAPATGQKKAASVAEMVRAARWLGPVAGVLLCGPCSLGVSFPPLRTWAAAFPRQSPPVSRPQQWFLLSAAHATSEAGRPPHHLPAPGAPAAQDI